MGFLQLIFTYSERNPESAGQIRIVGNAGSYKIEVHFATGNGGNKIYIVPSLRMVIAIASSAYNQPYGQRRSQDIPQRVLAVVDSK